MRSRVHGADELVLTDRKDVPVGAICKAPLAGVGGREPAPDLRVRSRVEEQDAAGVDRERLPVRADCDRPHEVAWAVHDADRRGAALERRQQVAAGLRRAGDRDCLAGEQEREVEMLLDERLGAEPLHELRGFRVAGLAALDRGEDPAGDGRGQQDGHPDEKDPEATVDVPNAPRLLLRGFAALGDELALEIVDVERVLGGPVEGGGKASAAVELALITSRRIPLRRRLGDVTAEAAPFGVLVDPLAQSWPFAQESLVGDLDVSFGDGDETAVGQRREHVGSVVVALQVELGQWRAAAHDGVALSLSDEPQHDGAHELLVPVRNPGVRAFGQPCDCALNPSGLAVGGQRERVALPLLPELEQGGGEKRHRARLSLDVVDQRVGQLRLDPQTDAAGGQLDHAPQLRGLHRPDEHVVGAEQPGEFRVGAEASVEVGAQRDHDHCATARIGGGAGEGVGEGGALCVGVAGSEQLLELVDGEEHSCVRGESVEGFREGVLRPRHEHAAKLVERPFAGTQQEAPPALAAGKHPTGEGREESGAEDGRLAAARWADDAEESGSDEAGDELRNEPLAAEEVVGIGRLEAREALERTDPLGGNSGRRCRARDGPRLLARHLQIDDLAGQLGLDLAQVAPARSGAGGDVDEPAARVVDGDRERRSRQLATTRVALLRVLGKRRRDDRVECGRQLRSLLARRRRLAFEVREHDRDVGVAPERRLPDETLVEHATE